MKKILITCFAFIAATLVFPTITFADEIIDAQGNIVNCRIETVEEELVEYRKNDTLYTFTRENLSPIFNDYVDVKTELFEKNSITRISGKIIAKDMWSTIIKNDNGTIDIPFFRVKSVGVYKPY